MNAKVGTAGSDLWFRILARMAEVMPTGCFDTWVRPVMFTGCEGNTLRVVAPNETFRQALIENYAGVLHQAVAEVAGPHFEVQIESDMVTRDAGHSGGEQTDVEAIATAMSSASQLLPSFGPPPMTPTARSVQS